MDWSDLRIFLAVAQTGSLRQAAGLLRVTQPTVSRRLRTLEADLGLSLFDRDRDGHRLTAAGAELLPDIRAAETAVLRVEQRSLGLVGQFQETVRVEAGETAAVILAQGMSAEREGPKIELLVTGLSEKASGRQPDILVSHGLPEEGRAITRRVGSVSVAVYGLPVFSEGRTIPLSDADLSTLPWLGFVEEQEHYITMRWLRRMMKDRPPSERLMNTDLMIAAASAGAGVAVLPCFKGEAALGLSRLTAPIEELQADYWVVINPDLARNTAIRSAVDWIIRCFDQLDF